MAKKPRYKKARIPGNVRGMLTTAKRRGWVKTLSKMQGGLCHWCEHPLDGDATFEHLIPLSRGGDDSIQNGAAAHALCNHRKGNMLPDEYRAYLQKMEEAA